MGTITDTGAPTLERTRFICDVSARFTRITEYGISLEDLLAGRVRMPPAGVRFDIGFEGSVEGPMLNGSIVGTDHVYIRPDGREEFHVHGSVTTRDGAVIALASEATRAPRRPGSTGHPILDRITLHSAFPGYEWVNTEPVFGIGVMDTAKGELRIHVQAFE